MYLSCSMFCTFKQNIYLAGGKLLQYDLIAFQAALMLFL